MRWLPLSYTLLLLLAAAPDALGANLLLRGEVAESAEPEFAPGSESKVGFKLGGTGAAYWVTTELHPSSKFPSSATRPSVASAAPRSSSPLRASALKSPVFIRSGERIALDLGLYESGSVVSFVLTAP